VTYARIVSGSYINHGTLIGDGGIKFVGPGQLANFGTVTGTAGNGVYLTGGGGIANFAGGLISGLTGALVGHGRGTIVNGGVISGSVLGIDLRQGGMITNRSGGTISGDAGITLGRAGTVVNAGRITNVYGGAAIDLLGGGTVHNSGTIDGYGDGIRAHGGSVTNVAGATIRSHYTGGEIGGSAIYGAASVTNSGAIVGLNAVVFDTEGTVTNQAGGSIAAGLTDFGGLFLIGVGGVWGRHGAVTVNNAGVITNLTPNDTYSNQHGGSAVLLEDGGQIYNAASGHIDAGTYGGFGVRAGASTRLTNAGDVHGYIGIMLNQGTVSNLATGTITGYYGAAITLVQGGVVVNAGQIRNVYPAPRASIASDGIIMGAHGYVLNSGAVVGSDSGVSLQGGSVRNLAAGMISGVYLDGVQGADVVTNAGTIEGSADGVAFVTAGTLINFAGGLISGTYGVHAAGPITLTNAGTITGSSGVAVALDGGPARLIIDPGAVFDGAVTGAGSNSALELAAGPAIGVLAGIGSQYTGFDRIEVDAGAVWRLHGFNTLAASTTLADDGMLRVDGRLVSYGPVILDGSLLAQPCARVRIVGGLTMHSGSSLAASPRSAIEIGAAGHVSFGAVTVDPKFSITGAGTIGSNVLDRGRLLANDGTLVIAGGVRGGGAAWIAVGAELTVLGTMAARSLTFLAGGHETASFGIPTEVTSLIRGFGPTDTLNLQNFLTGSLSVAGNVLTAHPFFGGTVATFHFASHYDSSQFALASDGRGGTNIKFV
jgi:hypothetical protein